MKPELIYDLYGLKLAIPFWMPLAPVIDAASWDYRVVVAAMDKPLLPNLPSHQIYRDWSSEGWILHLRDKNGTWCEFQYSEKDNRIEVSGCLKERDLSGILLGPVLALLLEDRGYLLWHASALAFENAAILISGDSGRGKSTLCMALMEKGASLLSEDLTILSKDHVIPGYPLLRVCRGAGHMVTGGHQLEPVFLAKNRDQKCWLPANDLPGGWCSQPMPLAAVYLLDQRIPGPTRIVSLSSFHAIQALMKISYMPLLRKDNSKNQFKGCARLVQQAPVYTISAENDLGSLPELVKKLYHNSCQLFPT